MDGRERADVGGWRPARAAGGWGSRRSQAPVTASKLQPYRRGVRSRWSRLAVKVRAAVSATIPAVTPTKVLRTGTAVAPAPVPGPCAARPPSSAAARPGWPGRPGPGTRRPGRRRPPPLDAPQPAARRVRRPRPPPAPARPRRRCRDRRGGGPGPGSGSARRASPMGVSGEATTASPAPASPPARPTRPTGSITAAKCRERDMPSARSVSPSPVASNSSRAMIWPIITREASAASMAKSPRATDSARVACPTLAASSSWVSGLTSLAWLASRRAAAPNAAKSASAPPQAHVRLCREMGDLALMGPVERRGQEQRALHVLVDGGDVVGEAPDRHHLEGERQPRRGHHLAGQGLLGLLPRQRPQPDGVAGPHPPAAGQRLAQHDLLRPPRVGAPPGQDQRPVDGPAEAPVGAHQRGDVGGGWPGWTHVRDQEGDAGQPQVGHLRQPPQPVDVARVLVGVAADAHVDVLGQGGLQQARVGGFGAAGTDGGGHHRPGSHADEQGQAEQGPPADAEPRPGQRPDRRHHAPPTSPVPRSHRPPGAVVGPEGWLASRAGWQHHGRSAGPPPCLRRPGARQMAQVEEVLVLLRELAEPGRGSRGTGGGG